MTQERANYILNLSEEEYVKIDIKERIAALAFIDWTA